MGRTEAERVLTPERVAGIRASTPLERVATLAESHERLRAERDLLAAEVRACREWKRDIEMPPTSSATEDFASREARRMRLRAARAAVDAAGCLKGEGT